MKLFIVIFLKAMLLIFSHVAYGSLLTDADGLDLELNSAGSPSNLLGPDAVTQGWTPALMGTTLPAPVPDGSEIELSIYDASFSIFQVVASTAMPSLAAWTLSISDVDWPGSGIIESASIVSNSFAAPMVVSNTADTVTLSYAGGDFLSLGDPGLMATVNLDIAYMAVSEPSQMALIALMVCIYFYRRFRHSRGFIVG